MFWLGALAVLLVHPIHETVSEVEWNAKTKRVEVALRISVLDEQWLERSLQSKADRKTWALGYLKAKYRFFPAPPVKRTRVTPNRSANERVHWVGRKEDGSHVWWFFEYEPHDQEMPKSIEQRMFFERDQGYINRVVVLGQTPRRALELTTKKPRDYLKSNEPRD